MMDADTIADFIKADPRINKNKVFAHGRSLGGAVATHLAAKQSRAGEPLFKGVIVESTFTCISDMADQLFPFLAKLGKIKDFMMKLKWENNTEIQDVTSPVLFISGDKDTFVPTW